MRNHFSLKEKGFRTSKKNLFCAYPGLRAADTAPLELKSAQSHSAPRGARRREIRQISTPTNGRLVPTELFTCCSFDFGLAKVFVHLFQKVADSKGSAFGRWPQPAERFILQAYLGVWGPLQEKGPQGPSFLRPVRRETASPMGRWRAAPEGALALCLLPAAALPDHL